MDTNKALLYLQLTQGEQNFDSIKKQYKKLASIYHPDKKSESTSQDDMVNINLAYQYFVEYFKFNPNVKVQFVTDSGKYAKSESRQTTVPNTDRRVETEFNKIKTELIKVSLTGLQSEVIFTIYDTEGVFNRLSKLLSRHKFKFEQKYKEYTDTDYSTNHGKFKVKLVPNFNSLNSTDSKELAKIDEIADQLTFAEQIRNNVILANRIRAQTFYDDNKFMMTEGEEFKIENNEIFFIELFKILNNNNVHYKTDVIRNKQKDVTGRLLTITISWNVFDIIYDAHTGPVKHIIRKDDDTGAFFANFIVLMVVNCMFAIGIFVGTFVIALITGFWGLLSASFIPFVLWPFLVTCSYFFRNDK